MENINMQVYQILVCMPGKVRDFQLFIVKVMQHFLSVFIGTFLSYISNAA